MLQYGCTTWILPYCFEQILEAAVRLFTSDQINHPKKSEQDILSAAGDIKMNSYVTFSYAPQHMVIWDIHISRTHNSPSDAV